MKKQQPPKPTACRFCARVSRAQEAQRLAKRGLPNAEISKRLGVGIRAINRYKTQRV